ncbi:MAG TPA: class II glutamine amidotransferase [Myxococcales bacterium]|nr:class II glutamine amidotransferase [Myxococcales bacterium]
MAEFLAIHQSDASLLGCLLRRFAGRVSLGTAAAAGVGFFQSDDVLLRKRPLGGQPALPERLAEGVESEAALICSGVVGSSKAFHEQMTLPFRFKRWLFAIAGQPDGLTPVRAPLLATLADHLKRSVKGDSGAEVLFFSFLARLREAGRLDDHDVDAETAARSLAAAVGEAERAFEQMGQQLPPLALVATNGRVIAGLRRGHPLQIGVVDGLIPCARCEIGNGASDLDPRVKSHRTLRAAMLLSGATGTEGFRELAEREVIAIPRELDEVQSL